MGEKLLRAAGAVMVMLGLTDAGAAEAKGRRVERAARSVKAAPNEFVIFYDRPDGRYEGWNLWLWRQGGEGATFDFTGVKNGVAYFKCPLDRFFDARSVWIGMIVRTDTWQKDPGNDQQHFIRAGNRCVILSGEPRVHVFDTSGRLTPAPGPPEPAPTPPLPSGVREMLPEPVLDAHPRWIDLYWAAWAFMHEKISPGRPENGFVERYIDEGFNENIYQWDSCFMAAYAIYGPGVFPAMETLDNFYQLQRKSDGYICRTYNEETGQATGEADINPPLFAWMEWRYWRLTGDTSRLDRVLPALDRYYTWVKRNARAAQGRGLYFITNLGSGMDNSPREEYIRRGAWVDLSAQQALAALCLSRLAAAAERTALAAKYRVEYRGLRTLINRRLWNESDEFYYDRMEDGRWHMRSTIASVWPMTAGVAGPRRARAIIRHLKDPNEFNRPHLFPTLAAKDPLYDGQGHYWRGAVWAPTNFAAIKGIERYDRAFAFEAAVNHIEQMSRVYHEFDPASHPFPMPALSEPNVPRNGNGLRQIWEAYSPDQPAPATRWDAKLLVRQKFCGWSGIGPVALLIENVLGIDIDAPARTLTWRMRLLERHGIRRLRFGNNCVTIVADERRSPADPLKISGSVEARIRLKVYLGDSQEPLWDQVVEPGEIQINVTP